MLSIALYEPEIPPNTGNIMRLCANSGCQLHLIHPLGFSLQEKRLRRAGLDYSEWAQVLEHANYQAFTTHIGTRRIIACTTKATQWHNQCHFIEDDVLLFGPETRGLPEALLTSLPAKQKIRIPMQTGSRSLNLSNASAIVCYEALRQLGFDKHLLK